MRNKSYNVMDNLASQLNAKTQNMINGTITSGVSEIDRTTKDFRDGWLRYGAIQMKNIDTENYAIFGSGIGGRTVGP